MVSATIGGGLQSDTILTRALTAMTTSSIKGGDHGDSITIASGSLNGVQVAGNKGADTIYFGATAATNASVLGGMGNDTISFNTAGVGAAAYAAGVAGADSIWSTLVSPSQRLQVAVLQTPSASITTSGWSYLR